MQETEISVRNGNVLLLPPQLIKDFNLDYDQTITLKFGSAQTEARISEAVGNGLSDIPVPGLSANALSHFNIPRHTTLKLKQGEQNVFRLGPVIGVLTLNSIIEKNRLNYYLPFARLNKNNGLFYIFSAKMVNRQNKTIRGVYLDHKHDTWKVSDFPYPDVVIDRCYPNNYPIQSALEEEIGPKIFSKKNRINKLEFAETMQSYDFLSGYIPETKQYQDPADLDYFLEKYQGAFLKPVNGMMGAGIVEVKKENGELKCRYISKAKHKPRTVTENIISTDEIRDVLQRAEGRRRDYVIQQPVSRLEYKGGPFSFRVWAMKNGEGCWVVPGMFAKFSANKGFLTNFTAGARLVPLSVLINSILSKIPWDKQQLINQLEMLTLKTAEALDDKYGPLGELGIDIVLDLDGHPWLIEANGNPGKIPVLIQKEYPAWKILVYRYPLDYATYLADFRDHFESIVIS